MINHFKMSLIVLLKKCYFPSLLKDGNVTPIHKNEDKSAPSNYPPITLLSPVGKTIERDVHKRLHPYAIEHRILIPLQSGFINATQLHTSYFTNTITFAKQSTVQRNESSILRYKQSLGQGILRYKQSLRQGLAQRPTSHIKTHRLSIKSNILFR